MMLNNNKTYSYKDERKESICREKVTHRYEKGQQATQEVRTSREAPPYEGLLVAPQVKMMQSKSPTCPQGPVRKETTDL